MTKVIQPETIWRWHRSGLNPLQAFKIPKQVGWAKIDLGK
jgi:hypothetical protein